MKVTEGVAPAIRLRGVAKSYLEGDIEHRVLTEVDLEVAPGSFVALLGPSGSGKSTLLNLVGGIDLPTCGQVEVGGVAISELGEHERTVFRREQIGLVFQFFNLIPTLTVGENLLLPLELSGRLDDTTRRDALGLLDHVGLAERLDSFPDRLSGGEQQRVAIVRALTATPAVVLADEPTGNLDQETGERILQLLLALLRRRGAALLIATHDQRVAARADRVVRLRDGVIVAA